MINLLMFLLRPIFVLWFDKVEGAEEGGELGGDSATGLEDDEQDTDPDETEKGTQEPEVQKFKVGDNEVTLDEYESMKDALENKSKWQKNLTQQSQDLSEVKRLRDWLGNPNVSPQQKWEWWEQNFPKPEQQQKGDEDDFIDPDEVIPQMQKKMQQMEQMLQTNQQNQQQRAVQNDINKARSEFKGQWNDTHANIIKDRWVAKGGSLYDVAKQHFDEYSQLLSSQKKKWIDTKKQDANNPSFTPKGGSAPAAPKKALNEDERKEALGKELFPNG